MEKDMEVGLYVSHIAVNFDLNYQFWEPCN